MATPTYPLNSPAPHVPGTEETWELTTDSQVVLQVMRANRFGQPLMVDLPLGPNLKGRRFEISSDDRRDQQAMIPDPDSDPFRNGLMVRVDFDAQLDPEIASINSLSAEALMDLLDQDEAQLRTIVPTLAEVPLRRLLDLAERAGASHSKVLYLQNHVANRFRPGGSQDIDSGPGERLR